MQRTQKCPPHGKFTVGWIAALQSEYLAAKLVLDLEYSDPVFDHSKGDINAYTFGRIGEHDVVIATLPSGIYGTHPAAAVLNGLKSSFPLLQFVLMVGVAGGAPTAKNDVRLGDVVVGTKMIPYSVNKRYSDGPQFNGVPIMSGPKLLSATHKVRAKIAEDRLDLESLISEKFVKTERIRDIFRRPDDKSDRLYQPDYKHTSSCDCLQDDSLTPTAIVTRPQRRQYDRIKVHCGSIGSADSVVKDATERERLAREFDLLCFEMESAGLMAGFPCLPIRGICDYSDSHKNKQWQGYAAAIAAVFALSLILIVPYEDSQATGNDINTEALRQHIDLVVQTVMRIASPSADGHTLTLEDAGQAMEEIRDTIQKLKHLSDTSDANFNSTTDENEAAIEATKSRLNQIETGQKDMAKLLDELRGKIAEQHVNSPQEERRKWESLDKQVQKESTSLRETTRSTTEALQSTAATLNDVAIVTNNNRLGTASNNMTAAGRIIQGGLRGAERLLPRLGRGERSTGVRGPALSTGPRGPGKAPTKQPPRPVRAPLLPPPVVARQIPTGTIPTSDNPPPLPPRTVSQGSGVTRPDILEPPRDRSTMTPMEECPPVLPPRPPPLLPTRSDPGSYTFDRRGGVESPPSLDIPTPSTQRSRLFSSSSTGTESSAMSALVSDPPSLPPSSPRIPPTKPLKPRHLQSKAAVGLEGHNNSS